MQRQGSALLTTAIAALAIAGCGGANVAGSDDGGTSENIFVPVLSDWANYTSWASFQFDTDMGTADGLTHLAGHRVVYINHTPPHGSSAFPVGTLIVKELNPGQSNAQTFGMAKRGGNYNSGPGGAPGWEWWEFTPTAAASAPQMIWRGTAPPAGENYSGSPDGTCNDCHGAATSNDSVLAQPLALSNF